MNELQGTEEWFERRRGRATASRFSDVLATIKSGEAAGRRNYRAQLVVERLTGTVQESYTNAAMQWGKDWEEAARLAYEERSGNLVDQVGFWDHATLMAGASPDGLIDHNGGLEIKCPYQTAIHINSLLGGMPGAHYAQVQGCLWITDREWWDFVSYDPRMPKGLQLHIERISRDDSFITILAEAITTFLQEVDVAEKILQEMRK